MNVFSRLIVVLVTSVAMNFANAALLAKDFIVNSGDNWLTFDSQTGLEWLDVPLTASQNFDSVRTGVWYQRGFRHATKQELSVLFANAGTPDDGFDISNTHLFETLALINLLGATHYVNSSNQATLGFIGTDFLENPVTLGSHPLGSVFSAQLAKLNYFVFSFPRRTISVGEAHFTGGHPFSDEAQEIVGSFLVRSVPEPNSVLLMAIALLLVMLIVPPKSTSASGTRVS